MQKLARTSLRIQQQESALKRAQKHIAKKKSKTLARETVEYNRERAGLVKAHKKARREDWQLGPLAPRRDVGEGAEGYGAVGRRMVRGVEMGGEKKGGKEGMMGGRGMMEGGKVDWGIRAGDRVCVTGRGERDEGRIGEVVEVREGMGRVVVRGVNLVWCLTFLIIEEALLT